MCRVADHDSLKFWLCHAIFDKFAFASMELALVDNALQADGCALVKTKQAVLVTEYAAPIQAGESTAVVEKLADYLKSVGY